MLRFFNRLFWGAAFASVVFILTPALFAEDGAQDAPKRLKRAESFFGAHFDFHASNETPNIGANTTPEMVQAIIDAFHPDYLQVDCKGHPGYSSYPTNVGNPASGIVVDALKIWREVTAKNGVALYVHYSGVWDSCAVAKHPEWAVQNADGSRSPNATSVFGPYKDELLVPQLVELSRDYGIDGVWIDGDSWATQIDYSDAAEDAFRKATGIETIPTAPGQENWKEWFLFHQNAYRQYLRDYVSEVKKQAPNFQVASNWAFSEIMPEPVSADVDFISGDYSPNNSVNAARYTSRLMENQGVPWDLMAWSFGTVDGHWAQKPGFQLSREAAIVLAQGGGFQGYITQNPDGAVNLAKLPGMAETSKFCRARQALCQGSVAVPQIALFCPTEEYYQNVLAKGTTLFTNIAYQRPFLNRLLEKNYSVDVLFDKALVERADEFPVVVFYRGGLWSDELRAKIESYVQNGGSVVAIGNEPLEELRETLKDAEKVDAVNIEDAWFLDCYKLGKGKIVAFPCPVGSPDEFVNANGEQFNAFLTKAFDFAFDSPIITFDEPKELDVSVRKTADGKLAIHLVNVSGDHASAGVLEKIEPVENVRATLKLDKAPKAIRLEPTGETLDFEYADGKATFTIPSIPIYEIVVVDEN